jgi:hypothetical protein
MSVEPFKVMVMDDVARARQSLIAFLRASGLRQKMLTTPTKSWMPSANGSSILLCSTLRT